MSLFTCLRHLGAAPLATEICLGCRLPASGGLLCEGCKTDLPWNREACPRCAMPSVLNLPCPACLRRPRRFDAAWTAFRLQPPIHAGILGLKYAARFEQARLLGELMAQGLRERETLPDLLLPVPLHWSRLMRRGYNQALLLSRVVGRELQRPVDAGALRRLRRSSDQIGQSARARRRNLRGAFDCQRSLEGLHVALVDDVMTTGATFDELTRVCRRAGATRIEVWAAARTV